MQKKLFGVVLMGILSMSLGVCAAEDKPQSLLEWHTAKKIARDEHYSSKDLSHDFVNYLGDKGQEVKKDLFDIFGNIYHHLHDFKDRLVAQEKDEPSCGEKIYGVALASAMLTYGMRYAHVATQGWRAAAALGGNLSASLSATPFIGGGLKWATGAFGVGATKLATVATPWAGCIAGVLLASKTLYDCKELFSKEKFDACKKQCQAQLDLEKKAFIKANKKEAQKMTVEQHDEAKAWLDKAYTITDGGVKWHMLWHAARNNIYAIGDASFKIGVASLAVVVLGMLAQQNK